MSPTPALPLTDAGSIVVGNALRRNWFDVCPPEPDSEVFIVGNPPYLGSNLQDNDQKEDISIVFSKYTKAYKKLDYVAAWYAKAAEYNSISDGQAAFVATNSICQGEQVCILWPIVYYFEQEIIFAYTSFKWKNNATNNAAVICIIVGIGSKGRRPAKIFYEDRSFPAENVNPYLANAPTVIVFPRSSSISLPPMSFGNQFLDGGNLIFSDDEKAVLVKQYPQSERYFRQVLGSKELIQGDIRHCLWITSSDINDAQSILPIRERLEAVRAFKQRDARNAMTLSLAP